MASNPPFGGSADDQAAWANQNINSDFGVDAWKAVGPMDSGCPPRYPYRSQRAGGDNACVEHPDNCPEGKTLHGTTCITNEEANRIFGGGYGNMAPGAAPQAAPAAPAWGQGAPANPLQGLMTGLPQADISPVGGRPWGGKPGPESLAALMTPQQQPQYGALQSTTDNLLRAATSGAKPAQMMPGTLGTGWTSGQDGLTQMMARRQRGGQQGWWA